MNRSATVFAVAGLIILLCACSADLATTGGPPGSGAAPPDLWAPCTDPRSCCSAEETICKGDPDSNPVCTCSTLWSCTAPGKCSQDRQTPSGGGVWHCRWSAEAYICEGNPDQPPGGGGWSCSIDGDGKWVCTKAPPNPSNKPGGSAHWKCTVDNEAGKLHCERGSPDHDAAAPAVDAGAKDAGSGPDTVTPPPPPKTEMNCGDGIDNDGDGKVDCEDGDCPPCPSPTCPAGKECCDGIDNDGDGKIDEGNVCAGVGEPCPPGAFQACDCYCGVHRKCAPDGTWGPCKVDGNGSCAQAKITSHDQCPKGTVCDYGKCVIGWLFLGQCKKHTDCPAGKVCDLGACIKDKYTPCP